MNAYKIYKVASVWLWSLIVVIVVVLALYVSMGRHYLPQLGLYQNEIVTEIEARAGIKISVGKLEGFWSQLSPGLELIDVDIPSAIDGSLPGISADELEVTIDFFSSVAAFTPLLDSLLIKNPDIHLYQDVGGDWTLAGFQPSQPATDSASSTPFKELLEAASYVQIENADIYFHPHDATGWAVGGLNIDLYQGVGVRLSKILVEDISGDIVLEVDAESRGNFGDSDYRIKAHGIMDELDIIPLLTLVGIENIGASGLNGELWFKWNSSIGGSLQGNFAADDFRVSSSEFNNATRLSDLKTNYLVDVDLEANVSAWVTGLSAEWKNSVYPLADFNLVRSNSNDISFSLRDADVSRLLKLASRVVKLPEKLADVLTTIAPKGTLENIGVAVAGGVPFIEGFSFSAMVKDLNSMSWSGAPGVDNFSGYITGSALSGRFDVDAKNLLLSFPGIYENKIPASRLLGSVGWDVGEDSVIVNSGPLDIDGDFGSGNAHLDLEIPLKPADEKFPLMSLLIGMKDFDVKYRNQVIPAVVGESLIEWLDQSILAGKASDVGFIYYGSLLKADTPRQVVQVELDAVGAKLKYDPAWPPAENIDTKVIVSNGDTHGYVKSATIYSSRLDNIDVAVLPGSGIINLDVSGDINGPATDILKLFKETSLKDVLGPSVSTWKSTGAYTATLTLAMPLVSGVVPDINVVGELHDVDLENTAANLVFAKLRGDISYGSQSGLSANNIDGSLWGRPLQASINTVGVKEKAVTTVNMSGSMEMSQVQQWLNQPALGFAVGITPVEGKLSIAAESNGGVQLDIRSKMEGVAIDLPEPFFKARSETMGMNMHLDLSAGSLPVKLSLGKLAKMSLITGAANDDFRGIVVVGGKELAPLPEAGLGLTGSIDKVLLDEWLSVVDRYESFAGTAKQVEGQAAKQSSGLIYIDSLHVGELNAFGQVINGPKIGLYFTDSRWTAKLKHERLVGRALLPTEHEKLALDLEYIHLPLVVTPKAELAAVEAADTSEDEVDPLAGIDPGDYIPLRVVSRSTFISDTNLGSWEFDFTPNESGAVVSGIKANVSGMRISGFDDVQGGDLFWVVNNGEMSSEFSGILSADNIGGVFEAQGIDPPMISKDARFIANLRWAGSPAVISLKRFDGDIQIDMRDGQFLQTSGTAADALKLLGVLNFNNLVRRLQLDFSDLYKKGLSYKSVDGIMLFNNGMLTINEPLHVKGPSSDFKMTGGLDLEQQTIDGKLVVTLPITSNLPWIVALAGGLPAAAGTYLASLIFEKQLNKLSSAVYKISGTWSEPEITFDRLFDIKEKKKVTYIFLSNSLR